MIPKGTLVTVMTRADLVIARPGRLRHAARTLPLRDPSEPDRVRAALIALVAEYGADALADHPEKYGLAGGDYSTVIALPDPDDDPWLDTWGADFHHDQIIARFDGGLAAEIEEHLTDGT